MPSLPTSPAAQAFFRALDDEQSQNQQQNPWIRKRIQTLGWRNRHSQDDSYPCTVQGRSIQVQQVQRGEVEGTYGTGATVWPAAMVLIKYLERHPELVQGRCVADLGAGTGLTSLAAAVLGASKVYCTDGEASVVRLAQDNVERCSSPGCPLVVQEFWWGRDRLPEPVDVVLVADCVLPKLYPIDPLVEALDQLLTEDETSVAFLSYEHRYFAAYDPRVYFRESAESKGLRVDVIPLEEQDEVYSVDDIEIWRVQRQR